VAEISSRFQELVDLIPQFEKRSKNAIKEASICIAEAFENGNKILICGNGGSAADSQHFAAEFVNAFSRDLDRKALPALALTTDTSILTSIANDFDYNNVFSRQVAAYGNPGDVLIALTTSGESENCINAVKIANALFLRSIVFSKESTRIGSLAEISIEVPSNSTQHIQECHLLAYHVVAELVEDRLFRKDAKA
jgi:D-sedoheptulose 7-phosphate isomerase